MASLTVVLGFFSCALSKASLAKPTSHLEPSTVGEALHKPSFLKASPTKPLNQTSKTSATPALNSTVKAASQPHHNATKLAEDILHPKVEYDPETAALMAQADDAIKEAESVNNAPPKPAPKDPKAEKDEVANMGMIKALRGMVCNHKIKKHLSLCDLNEFQGAQVKSEVQHAAIPDPDSDNSADADSSNSASIADTNSVASRADDLMAKVDSLQKSVAASMPEDAKSALLDVVHDAAQVSKKHTTGAEAAALMKNDVTAGLPASVRDTILSVMKDAKAPAPSTPTTTKNEDVTAGLPASVRDTVLAVMKDSKH
jgi:hypothetical protein